MVFDAGLKDICLTKKEFGCCRFDWILEIGLIGVIFLLLSSFCVCPCWLAVSRGLVSDLLQIEKRGKLGKNLSCGQQASICSCRQMWWLHNCKVVERFSQNCGSVFLGLWVSYWRSGDWFRMRLLVLPAESRGSSSFCFWMAKKVGLGRRPSQPSSPI